jgi:NUMOD4 motif-containing protein/HNH endonuclease/NUMOD1 domain-containing protein
MNEEIEIFVSVNGYDGIYEISNFGRIKSLKRNIEYLNKNGNVVNCVLPEKILIPGVHTNGYLKISLYKNAKEERFFIHRLVAIHFILNPENKPQVNHKDGDRKNCKLNNLEWATGSENKIHSFTVLGRKNIGLKGKDNVSSKVVLQYDLNGNFLNEFESSGDARRRLGLSSNHITDCCTGKLKNAYGFIWKFKTANQ